MTMNVVLVVFDTLRKDAVGSYGLTPPWEMERIATPHLDALARDSVRLTNAYPESLPTLCARRAIYTGQRTYPFHNGDFRALKGDFVGVAPGWGPIPNEQHTLSEILQGAGYRTALISDLYHQFKPSKNFWRGFDQWAFIRGQETDNARSGPGPTQEELDQFIPRRLQELRRATRGTANLPGNLDSFSTACILNMRDRVREELWFNAQVFQEAARWLEQNRDAERFFLTVESFDPHEPWFVPEHYRRAYDTSEGQEQVLSPYAEIPDLEPELVRRTRANYAGLVTMCDRWFGHLMETLRVLGLLENTLVIVTSDHGHTTLGAPGVHRQARLPVRSRSHGHPDLRATPGRHRGRHGLERLDPAPRHRADDPGGAGDRAAGARRRALVLGHAAGRRPVRARPRRDRLGHGDDRRHGPLVVQREGRRDRRAALRPDPPGRLRSERG